MTSWIDLFVGFVLGSGVVYLMWEVSVWLFPDYWLSEMQRKVRVRKRRRPDGLPTLGKT